MSGQSAQPGEVQDRVWVLDAEVLISHNKHIQDDGRAGSARCRFCSRGLEGVLKENTGGPGQAQDRPGVVSGVGADPKKTDSPPLPSWWDRPMEDESPGEDYTQQMAEYYR